MPISVSMPTELFQRASALASARHFGSFSEYVRERIRADLADAAEPTQPQPESDHAA